MAHMNIAKKQPANRPLPVIPHPVKAPKIAAQPKAQAPAANDVAQLNNALQNRVVIAPKQPAVPKAISDELNQLENKLHTEMAKTKAAREQVNGENKTLNQKRDEIKQHSIQAEQAIDDFVEQALALLEKAAQN